MITYRAATPTDADAVARPQAHSWQQHYRGIMRDDYLDHAVHKDRQAVWSECLQHPSIKQHIVLAMNEEEPCGFACTYAQHDPHWGALLDNLHVLDHSLAGAGYWTGADAAVGPVGATASFAQGTLPVGI